MPSNESPIQIALVGYGAMGRMIEELAPEYGCGVSAVFDEGHTLAQRGDDTVFDVAIDFSLPDAVEDNVRQICAAGRNIVIGTTGWRDREESVRHMIAESGLGCVAGSNFSVGMQMFFRIVDAAAHLADRYDDYDLMLHELHHKYKADSPSGTALSLAGILQNALQRKSGLLKNTAAGPVSAELLHVTSTRGGEIPGTHTVYIDSAADTLELTHRARNRSGFARGALRAARWIHGKQGFYDFSEIFDRL